MHVPSQSSSYKQIGPCNGEIRHATSIGDALPFNMHMLRPNALCPSPLSAIRLEGGHPNVMRHDISAAIMHGLGFSLGVFWLRFALGLDHRLAVVWILMRVAATWVQYLFSFQKIQAMRKAMVFHRPATVGLWNGRDSPRGGICVPQGMWSGVRRFRGSCRLSICRTQNHTIILRCESARVEVSTLSGIDSSRMTHVSGFVEPLCVAYAPTTLLHHKQARIRLLCCNSASQSQGKETGYCPV